MKLLLVEDDTALNEMLQTIVKPHYEFSSAYSGTEALLLLKHEHFDLVVLDLMLPGKSGQDTLTELRETSSIPVIILTALSDKETTVRLLQNGANDYLTKPFDPSELLARISIHLRIPTEQQHSAPEMITFKNLSFDTETFIISINDIPVNFSKKEIEILSLLLKNPKRVFTKDLLYQQIWGDSFYGDENTINVHISNIRSKLKKADPETTYIETVWAIGIKLQTNDTP